MSFNSRSPSGERPSSIYRCWKSPQFQLTLPEWGATRALHLHRMVRVVSTHAPRVGSDRLPRGCGGTSSCFNSRSPSGERRHTTPRAPRHSCFNSRSPSGERLWLSRADSPCVGFQLTLPEWGATVYLRMGCYSANVSTHAPRVGSDRRTAQPT